MPLNSLDQLRPKPDQRMILTGSTGSGKTTLARELLKPFPQILVVDSKCTYGGKGGEPGYKVVTSPQALKRIGSNVPFIQYRPDVKQQNTGAYDQVYEWAYRRGGPLMIYSDELFLVHHGSYAPDWLRACVTCGRELGIGMIGGTQRPRGIDLRLMTEAENFVTFELRHRDDRKRMAEMMGDEVMVSPPRHAFWAWRAGDPAASLCRLKLQGG